MEDKIIEEQPEKWFGMSIPEGVSIQIASFQDGAILIELQTKRDGDTPLATGMKIGPKTFHLLTTALFCAAHNPDVWKPWVVENSTDVCKKGE